MHTHITKRSKQRDRIFHVLKRTRSHPTAEWVFDQVREEMPKISLGTVYRNLHVLKEQGKIQELDFGEGIKRYDAFLGEHYHFVCEMCGTVQDLEVPRLQDVNARVQEIVPERIRSHRLDFFGTCTKCSSKI
ncbi:MAG: transcriptional repressor [Ignavibacteria bacterium GWA2_55_11]|nr:MAG: transcriptional repressor [Ignavibacteria bacterium GWA2_55_11]OGU43854.1 MAG: transcriptional repressor [Ignavibacteria bacterium GWC2_56_12]OGU67627.1 MAG: transcriptional repressor [Ignavibacteria bacterium RIFCSPHIGHO2_02_FULL_56_12]OGU71945.1 MAG: transcriptional repressor [Ignavibacteria bacterium RIFCSPLOWO2_02_FULL_55_14]OGU73139.1 MAG: transcriptional repressor [Ignavibacteria bacterium RIFCSPLOWO2_12_FULL_56_21]HAV23465.1 transcriptional repressor [Bacteroidota bacterium]